MRENIYMRRFNLEKLVGTQSHGPQQSRSFTSLLKAENPAQGSAYLQEGPG